MMKKYLFSIILLAYTLSSFSQGVGVNDDGSIPDAMLHVKANGRNDSLVIFTNDKDATKDSVLVMKSDGNVGIGTTAPTEKLEVAGSVKIVDGTEGNGKLLISDANGKGSWEQLFGTSWSNVTGSRALNTTYTNNTGRPMYVSVAVSHSINFDNSTAIVDGAGVSAFLFNVTGMFGFNIFYHSFIVPVGSTYQIKTVGTGIALNVWRER